MLSAEAPSLYIKSKSDVQSGVFIEPLPFFKNHPNISVGHTNLILDADGIVRNFPILISSGLTGNQKTLSAFSKEISSSTSLVNKSVAGNFPDQVTKIVYAMPAGSVRRIPFYRLIDGSLGDVLKNKIVLLGVTSPDLHDEQLTPLSRGTQMPGVEIQANIVNMFLLDYHLTPISKLLQIIWIFLASLISAIVFLYFSSRRILQPIFVNIFLGVLQTVLIVILFSSGSVSNFLHVNFSWILSTASIFSYRYFTTERDRLNLKNLFSKYVSKDVLEEILKDPTKVKLGGEQKEVTVFFSDIRGFTTLSEKVTPTVLVEILNKYFTVMTEQVMEHGGVVDKYIGDAVMAFWGAPIDDEGQADHAVLAGLSMLSELKKFNQWLSSQGRPEINIGVGIYTGPAIVGNIGSDLRFDYTVMGDTVNVASRLEGLNKEHKTNIIIGETTKNKLKGSYNIKALGSVAVKGRAESLNIYAVSV